MRQKSGTVKEPAEKVVKDIRRVTRKRRSAEQKIRIVLSELRGDGSIAAPCRREGIAQCPSYSCSNSHFGWTGDSQRGRNLIQAVL
jgi:transposase